MNVKFLQICPDKATFLIYILNGLMLSTVSANNNFWVYYYFKYPSYYQL